MQVAVAGVCKCISGGFHFVFAGLVVVVAGVHFTCAADMGRSLTVIEHSAVQLEGIMMASAVWAEVFIVHGADLREDNQP